MVSFNRKDKFHPLLISISKSIRKYRADLPELCSLDVANVLDDLDIYKNPEDLFIHNEFHCCTGLRKIHLELASFGKGLQILHCVFFPDPRYDLPIFGADLVTNPKGVSAAIVDLSPVGAALPTKIVDELKSLEKPDFALRRELPEWGDVFSEFVQFVQPEGKEEEDQFLDFVNHYLRILLSNLNPLIFDSADSRLTFQRQEAQKIYCCQQKRNDKTRNVLAKAFNLELANRYIEEVLFDTP